VIVRVRQPRRISSENSLNKVQRLVERNGDNPARMIVNPLAQIVDHFLVFDRRGKMSFLTRHV